MGRRALAMAALVGCVGCAPWTPALPGGAAAGRPFADVPAPPECKLERVYVYQGKADRYGILLYKGRPRAQAVVEHYKRAMPREGWSREQLVQGADTTIRYAKGSGPPARCEIKVGRTGWLGSRYVLVIITGGMGP